MRKDIFYCKEDFERSHGVPYTFKKDKFYYLDITNINIDGVLHSWLKKEDKKTSPYNPSILIKKEDLKKTLLFLN